MTDPLLWLDGDPTDGRRARPDEPEPEPAAAAAPPDPAPAPRRGGRFGSALAGGLVAAVLVGGAALALGVGDSPAPTAPAAAATAAPAVGAKQRGDVAAIYAAASPSVVSVRTAQGSGTGFVVDSGGVLVTNAHVVGNASTVQVQFSDDSTATARVTGVDTSSDLALLKVDTKRSLRALTLADSSAVRTGELAVAIGSPFGLPQTATAGIVSGTGRHIQAPNGFQIDSVIQTDAPINPGNSGGPLLNSAGQVIGVNSQIATGGSGNGSVGIGFAVPSNTVRDVIPRLERGETIRRPYLGLSSSAGSAGVTVASVVSGGPAASAGIQAGDTIAAVGGKAVQTPDDVAAAIQDRRPGDSVSVTVRRGGAEETLQVKLGTRPATTP